MTSPEEKIVVLNEGDVAPDFGAPLFPAGEFHLSEFRNASNVILAFYPKDGTPGCTMEMCAFSADLMRFQSMKTSVFGVSCDSIESHKSFSERNNLTVPLISDVDGAIGRLYGALRQGRSSANRKLFLIDKSGIIRHIFNGMPDNSELLKCIESL